MQKKILRNDVILISFIILLAFASVWFFGAILIKEGNYVAVTVDGELLAEYPLNKNIETPIFDSKDTEYKNLLIIKDGKAFISDANCPDKICVAHRPISKTGETIVCLPHKLVISVEDR